MFTRSLLLVLAVTLLLAGCGRDPDFSNPFGGKPGKVSDWDQNKDETEDTKPHASKPSLPERKEGRPTHSAETALPTEVKATAQYVGFPAFTAVDAGDSLIYIFSAKAPNLEFEPKISGSVRVEGSFTLDSPAEGDCVLSDRTLLVSQSQVLIQFGGSDLKTGKKACALFFAKLQFDGFTARFKDVAVEGRSGKIASFVLNVRP